MKRASCTLPSATSACRLMSGDTSAVPSVILHTLGRALLIAAGITMAGERDMQRVGRHAIGAALAIEVFALTWAAMHQRSR